MILDRLTELIKRGEALKGEYTYSKESGSVYVSFDHDEYLIWIGECYLFCCKYLKQSPLFRQMESAYNRKENVYYAYNEMVSGLRTIWRQYEEAETEEIQPVNSKKIFISHSTQNREITDMLINYFYRIGVPKDSIFCSSYAGNDVKINISAEIKEALENSILNIAVLSEEYYKSVYCQNEAGILWYMKDEIPVILIALEGIGHNDMQGFLNSDYKYRRLDNQDDIAYIYGKIKQILGLNDKPFDEVLAANKYLCDQYREKIDVLKQLIDM